MEGCCVSIARSEGPMKMNIVQHHTVLTSPLLLLSAPLFLSVSCAVVLHQKHGRTLCTQIATTQVHRRGETEERNDHAVYVLLLSWSLQLELNLPTNNRRKKKCKQTRTFITPADAVLIYTIKERIKATIIIKSNVCVCVCVLEYDIE